MTGIVGNQWSLDRFEPMAAIPTTVRLTSYAGESSDFMRTPLQEFVNEIEEGRAQIKLGHVFGLHEIAEAHRAMEDNTARGKLVVVSD
jgi:NADPH:quinone reductase-like Zn-dependent oxidoreductase